MSAGGVVRLHALANVPALSAASSLCFGSTGMLSSRRMPGANGAGNVTTTVCASGAATFSGLPSTIIASVSVDTGATFGSYSAANVNSTSSAVNGWPSEKLTPARSLSVYVKWSADSVQLSASHGSTSQVLLLTRTRRAWVSSETRSELTSLLMKRLNDFASVRSEATMAPPEREGEAFLTAVAPEGAEAVAEPSVDGAFPPQAAATAPAATSAITLKYRTVRMCLVKNCPGGQKLGR